MPAKRPPPPPRPSAAELARGELVALDPGLIHPAVAIFRGGLLVHASRVRLSGVLAKVADVGERCRLIALEVGEHLAGRGVEAPLALAFERVQIYRAAKSKGDPNDLVPLAIIAGQVSGLVPGARVISPTPREWSGGTSKAETGDPWASPRGERVRRRLSGDEFAAVIATHDAVDAAAIGLWALGRFERARVFPGATPG